MIGPIRILRHSLVLKLILTVGLTLLVTISAWAYFNIEYQKEKVMQNVVGEIDRLSKTIKLGTHYAMMLNSRDDINQIINNIGRQAEITNIRIFNKAGQIKFSNHAAEIDRTTNIKAEACDICHRSEPPLHQLALSERTRIFYSPRGYRLLGIIDPIRNEPGCATDQCHVHPSDKKILGALDVVVSMEKTDREIRVIQKQMIGLAILVFLVTSTIIFFFVLSFVNRPIKRLIEGTRRIAHGDYDSQVKVEQVDELGQLAGAVNKMGKEIGEKQARLNEQRDEYQTLFERAPCLITVQDRKLRLLQYNREFVNRFGPNPGKYCYQAYKASQQKCSNCPVERTFADGQPHSGEESGIDKNGNTCHWIFRTTPIKNDRGEIVAAMEMSLDITARRLLEQQLEASEKKYHDIFNNIPNPVFVLDAASLKILDCNHRVTSIYGYNRGQILNRSFMELFREEDRQELAERIRTANVINQVKQIDRQGRTIYVDIWVSPAEYPGKKVLLVATSDITQRLEAEQQLIQASKMATLGEMATGVAHELNQPLSVIKTVSSFFIRKIDQKQDLDPATLHKMLAKVDTNIDRATKIINHMRQFARKSELDLEKVQVNEVLQRAFEIFSQQLKVRGIEVTWDIQPELPKIKADPGRLEQVIINLLINARDAIEEKWARSGREGDGNRINISTRTRQKRVIVKIEDTGIGIPRSILDKLFEPFFTTKEVGKGTGLGLSISYGIVKDCGGRIDVTSEEGRGACFTLSFPAVQNTRTDSNPAELKAY